MLKNIQSLTRISLKRISLNDLPENSGVYLFRNADGEIIYVGKAINLKNRVKSYFVNSPLPKTAKMLTEVRSLSFVLVNSDLESLLLEAFLIKSLQPKYNTIAKDDKHPLYIKITKEIYPRVLTARKVDEKELALAFFGPFPSSYKVRGVLRMLRKIFPYSDHKLGERPCLYNEIGLCNPCPNLIKKTEEAEIKKLLREKYLSNIKFIKQILSANFNKVVEDLYSGMVKFSSERKFEEASVLRDQIEKLSYITQTITPVSDYVKNPNLIEDIRSEELFSLRKILSNFIEVPKRLIRIECFDVAHLAGSFPTASMVTFINGEPEKVLYRHFRIHQIKRSDDIASLSEVAKRRIKHLEDWGIPDLIIVDGGKGQVMAFKKFFSQYKIPVVGLAKEFETLVFPKTKEIGFRKFKVPKSPAKNLLQRIRNEAHRFARRYHHNILRKSLIS